MSDDARSDAVNDAHNSADGDEADAPNTDAAEASENAPETTPGGNTDNSADDADTFPREYVESLRKESAGYRERAKAAEERAEALGKRLHAELVAATGKLADPDALSFDAEHLDDADKLNAAIDALVEAKPYLKARKVAGDAGQGPRGGADNGVNLLELLKGAR